MHDIDWNNYRHPQFLHSISLTLNELKLMNLFLKRSNFRIDANPEHLQETTLISPRRSLNPSKLLTQEKVSIKI
ncbi:MAG: hypothetical protein KGD74_05585 [Candidatus Lokiarchaeota archaeon]|nr:hypothetical protein [Candidatus Lokiarchaeota archaeon]